MRESDAYLRDGKVRGHRKVFLLLYYITGKAYDFYTQKVAIDEERWTIPRFYEELFNFCFPVDYRMQLHINLARCHQNDKSVAEYTHELQDLFNMIGNIPKQDQVLKFWNSARPSIQKELWRNKLNPEISSWDTVVAQAEIIEIVENVAERRDQKSGSQAAGTASGSGGGASKGKNQSADASGSVRAVTFGSRQGRSRGKHHHKNSHGAKDVQSKGGNPHSREGTPANSGKGKSKSGSVPPPGNGSYNRNGTSKTNQLSEKEIAEYRAAGKCFNCGNEGHMSRNCPDNATVKSKGQGPPGASSFNVEPVLLETDMEDHVEILDSLPLGAMFFGDPESQASVIPWPIEEWRSHYPYWNEPRILARARIGDCLAMVADTILKLQPSFPGDRLYDAPDLRPELRFFVKQDKKTRDYLINDRLTSSRLVVARCLMENPDFDISHWFAEQRVRALGLTEEISHHGYMGDAIAIMSTKLLMDGISSSYPCTKSLLDPTERFRVERSSAEGYDEYFITDLDLNLVTRIRKAWLEEPDFDLVGWYRELVYQRGHFEFQYYDTHWEMYGQPKVEVPVSDDNAQCCTTCTTHHEFLPCHVSGEEDLPEPKAEDSEWDDLPELEPPLFDDDFFEVDHEGKPELDDVPSLEIVSDSDDSDNEGEDLLLNRSATFKKTDLELAEQIKLVLTQCQPYLGDGEPVDPSYEVGEQRFIVERQDRGLFCVYDRVQGFEADIHVSRLYWDFFSIGKWFAEKCAENSNLSMPWICAHEWLLSRKWEDTTMGLTS